MGCFIKGVFILLVIFIFRPLQFGVWQYRGDEQEERGVLVVFDKRQCFLLDHAGRVMDLLRQVIAIQHYFFIVVPKVGGIVTVRLPLAIVSEKFIEAFAVGIAAGTDHAQAPFAERTRNVAGLLQQLCKCVHGIGQRLLPFGLYFLVAADVGMTGVLPRKQGGS